MAETWHTRNIGSGVSCGCSGVIFIEYNGGKQEFGRTIWIHNSEQIDIVLNWINAAFDAAPFLYI